MDRQAHWQSVYSTKDETAVSWFQARPETSLRLIGGCPPPARIVDVGGGASTLVDHLLDVGYEVSVLDISEAALVKSQSRLGARAAAVQWLLADVTVWQPDRQFDVWHDRAVFHFLIDKADRQAYAEAMAAAVKPGGLAVVATFAIDGPEKCSGLPVCRYDAQELAGQFAGAFALIDQTTEQHRTPWDSVQFFQYVVLRRL